MKKDMKIEDTAEECRWFASWGMSTDTIAERLGYVSASNLERVLSRGGYKDLVELMRRNGDRPGFMRVARIQKQR